MRGLENPAENGFVELSGFEKGIVSLLSYSDKSPEVSRHNIPRPTSFTRISTPTGVPCAGIAIFTRYLFVRVCNSNSLRQVNGKKEKE